MSICDDHAEPCQMALDDVEGEMEVSSYRLEVMRQQ